MIIDAENVTKKLGTTLDFEQLNNTILDEIDKNFKAHKHPEQEILNILLLITCSSTDAYLFSDKVVPQFYSKLLAQYVYEIYSKKDFKLNKFSENLKEIKRRVLNNTALDAFGASVSASKQAMNADDHWLLGQIKEDIVTNFRNSSFPSHLKWLRDLDLTKISTHNFGADIKKKRIEETHNILKGIKNKIVKIIFEKFTDKSFLDLDKLKISLLLGDKAYQAKLNLILNIVLEANNEKLLTEFFDHCGDEVFRYYFNTKFDRNILLLFLLRNKRYELACNVLERAKSLSVYFEFRTFEKASSYAASINTFYTLECMNKEEATSNPVKKLISPKPTSFILFGDLWNGSTTKAIDSYYENFKEKLSNIYGTFKLNYTKEDELFEEFMTNEEEYFNTRYPFVTSLSEDGYNMSLKIHLFRHNLKEQNTDLACQYDCYAILAKLQSKLASIFNKDFAWILCNDNKNKKWQIKRDPLINGAALHIYGDHQEIRKVTKIISHPFFRMREGCDLSVVDILPYILQISAKDVYVGNVKNKKINFSKSANDPVDSVYAHFGINSVQAQNLLSENLSGITETIIPGVNEAFLNEEFIHYMKEHIKEGNLVIDDILSIRNEYQSSENDANTLNPIENKLRTFVSNPTVMKSYINFNVPKKNGPHPSVLHALAKIQNIKLYLWIVDKENQLIPHPKFSENHVDMPSDRIDLLFVNDDQLERLYCIPEGLVQGYNNKENSDNNSIYCSPAI